MFPNLILCCYPWKVRRIVLIKIESYQVTERFGNLKQWSYSEVILHMWRKCLQWFLKVIIAGVSGILFCSIDKLSAMNYNPYYTSSDSH